MENSLRNDIKTIKAYVPGKPIDLVQRELGIKKVIKLASNENALGASPKAKAAIKKNIDDIFRYPDGSCYYLKKAMAKKLKLSPENLLFGNGSDEIIDIIIKTFLNHGDEVLTSETTFVEYEIIAKANNFVARTVPLKNFTYDLAALQAAVNEKTKLIFIANPNNPTGTYVSHGDLLAFLASLPLNKVVVIDEAYLEFTDAKDYPKLLSLITQQNIILLRTFSKAYGLAGLRIGYALARPEYIRAMESIRQPFNVNVLAQKAAEAALGDKTFLKKTAALIKREKLFLYKELKALRLNYMPSQANFIFFKTPVSAVMLCNALLRRGVIIRDLKQYNLDQYVRVTIGTPQENKLFIKELTSLLKKSK